MLRLIIDAPEGILFEGKIEKVTIPTQEGMITVLPDHMPLFSLVKKGEVIAQTKTEGEKKFSVPGGVCVISDNEVNILIA